MRETIESTTVLLVAGKGGVGKSTVSVATAIAAAQLGRRTAIIELSPSPVVEALSASIANGDAVLGSSVEKLSIIHLRPEEVLVEYLEDHGMAVLGRRLISTGVVSVIATAIPGIRELLVLAKTKQMERSGDFDTIILDAPASGHLVTFLSSPKGLADIASVGLLRSQAEEVTALLGDPSRSKVVMVTLAEETPVSETIETVAKIAQLKTVAIGKVVINGLIQRPDISSQSAELLASLTSSSDEVNAYNYVSSRATMQSQSVAVLAHALSEITSIELPFLFTTALTTNEASTLARYLIDPSIRLGMPDVG